MTTQKNTSDSKKSPKPRLREGVLLRMRKRQDWREDLRQGFAECFRVLKPNGALIFKWCENQIKVSEVLALTDQKPLFGHKSGKRMGTHWICFMKEAIA